MEPLVVRAARVEDFHDYISLLGELPGSETNACPGLEEHQAWMRLLVGPLCRCFMAEMNQQVIATVTALLSVLDTEGQPSRAHLHNFVVNNQYRGSGVGAFVLDSVREELRNIGVSAVELQTQQQRAVQFYQRNGFQRLENGGIVVKLTPPSHNALSQHST